MDENSAPTPEPDDTLPLRSFDELMADDELTPESLQSQLNQYAEAIRQEYQLSTEVDPENVSEYTTDFFRKNVHAAAAQIVWLSTNAYSESVRGNMSKYIIEKATADSDAAGDPIKDLLAKLTKNDPVT
jgi:hypothetical protein